MQQSFECGYFSICGEDGWQIDNNNSDEECLYVDIEMLATVRIKANEQGISVNIFPFNVSDKPLASASVKNFELFNNNDDDEYIIITNE